MITIPTFTKFTHGHTTLTEIGIQIDVFFIDPKYTTYKALIL